MKKLEFELDSVLDLASFVAWLKAQDEDEPVGFSRDYEGSPFGKYVAETFDVYGPVEVIDDGILLNGEWLELKGWLLELEIELDNRFPTFGQPIYPPQVLEILNGMDTDNAQAPPGTDG